MSAPPAVRPTPLEPAQTSESAARSPAKGGADGSTPGQTPEPGTGEAQRERKEAAEAPSRNDVTQALALAEKAYQDRFYERAAFLAERQKGAAPVRAWELMGRASCGMRNPSRASVAYTHVKEDTARAQALLRACEQHGFILSDGVFQPRQVE